MADDMGIISREEFYLRAGFRLTPQKKVQGTTSVEELMQEIKYDAKHRSHSFLFNRTWEEICLMESQEQDGLKEFNYKTEGERFAHIEKELKEDTYETIRIYRDIDHPTIMHLSNGFHRIYMANKLGIKELRTETWFGKWEIENNITFEVFLGYLRNFKDIYIEMFSKSMKDANKEEKNKLLQFPDITTIDGAMKFCEMMIKKDELNRTITILGCNLKNGRKRRK